LGKGGKAEMALELLYLTEPSEVKLPVYIYDKNSVTFNISNLK